MKRILFLGVSLAILGAMLGHGDAADVFTGTTFDLDPIIRP